MKLSLYTDREAEVFKILARVRKGDTIAPYLFVIVLDYALREAISGRGVRVSTD